MRLLFLDDAGQRAPSRPGMGRLVAVGGVIVKEEVLGDLEHQLNSICRDEFNFPPGEVFKWSPSPNQWMHDNLVEDDRQRFFQRVLNAADSHGVEGLVMIDDATKGRATRTPSHELDVMTLILERFHNQFRGATDFGLVIAAEPSGGSSDERKFLADCRETLDAGTDYVDFTHIPINMLTTPFNNVRVLQLADLVTSCTTALVAGNDYAPPVFENIKPLFLSNMDCIGGLGVKIHPDYLYVNLYHWLLGDDHLMQLRRGTAIPLPSSNRPYATDPMIE